MVYFFHIHKYSLHFTSFGFNKIIITPMADMKACRKTGGQCLYEPRGFTGGRHLWNICGRCWVNAPVIPATHVECNLLENLSPRTLCCLPSAHHFESDSHILAALLAWCESTSTDRNILCGSKWGNQTLDSKKFFGVIFEGFMFEWKCSYAIQEHTIVPIWMFAMS